MDVVDYMWLVPFVVNGLIKRGRLHPSDVDEAISEGNYLLVKAWHKWEPSRGKFGTFAYLVIRHGVIDYLKKNRRFESLEGEVEDRQVRIEDRGSLSELVSEMLEVLEPTERRAVNVKLSGGDLREVYGNVCKQNLSRRWTRILRKLRSQLTES